MNAEAFTASTEQTKRFMQSSGYMVPDIFIYVDPEFRCGNPKFESIGYSGVHLYSVVKSLVSSG
ncbi:MAG: hypothetical protein ACI915_002968 [Gammaproteobacteria bacterium]|jgi:hypothetical protein